MLRHSRRAFIFIFCLFVSQYVFAQRTRPDNFLLLIHDIKQHIPSKAREGITFPTDDDLRGMSNALTLFRARMTDSCKSILKKYNYSLLDVVDGVTGNTYDVFKEKYPIKKGWGTFIYNRNHRKRLYIHINHPVDDPNADIIGAELFRKLGAEWLFMAGTPRFAKATNVPADIGRAKRSIFQRWHEQLSDLTHITLSVHAFKTESYRSPINATDIIISNGKTTDEQWGISQISLAFRDSMREAGFRCSLAMYDSGYARLSGGWNVQGTFSNDSAGFGHWLYVELSEKVRKNSSAYSSFIATANRALDLSGKKVSQQMNRAWGLVSPRVVRVDSLHRILFPPANAETYRIISFNANNMRNDTLDIRLGNWLEVAGSRQTITRVTQLDSIKGSFANQFRGKKRSPSDRMLSQIIKESPNEPPSKLQHVKRMLSDSSLTDDDEGVTSEPLQVHRIPLRPVLASTISNEYTSDAATPFRWEGLVSNRFTPSVPTFEIGSSPSSASQLEAFPNFLIPIINRSYRSGKSHFIGVQMTQMLVNEIARLVNEHKVAEKDVGLIAEELGSGDYYLRVFPSNAKKQITDLNP